MPRARENLVEIASFQQGVKSAPAFQNSGGGAFRQVNYVIDEDGEVIPRKGYNTSDRNVLHLSDDGELTTNGDETGRLVVVDTTRGRRILFRLPEGSDYVIQRDRLFYTTSDADKLGYWVDLDIPNVDFPVYEWTRSEEMDFRPSRLGIQAETYGGTLSEGVSHPLFIGLTNDVPSNDNPLHIFLKTGEDPAELVSDLTLSIREDSTGTDEEFFSVTIRNSGVMTISANELIEIIWRGEDGNGENHELDLATQELTAVGKAKRVTGHPRTRTTRGSSAIGYDSMNQDEWENAYLEISYDLNGDAYKYRYYLWAHKESDIASGISQSISAGLGITQVGAAFGPAGTAIGAGVGGAVALAGIAGSLISRAREGTRVKIQDSRTTLTPAQENETGFYPGQMIVVYTFSDNEHRTVETLPTLINPFYVFSFENKREGPRTDQAVNISLPLHDEKPEWADYINVYAARSLVEPKLDDVPQATGLEFQLIGQFKAGNETSNTWTDPSGDGRVISGIIDIPDHPDTITLPELGVVEVGIGQYANPSTLSSPTLPVKLVIPDDVDNPPDINLKSEFNGVVRQGKEIDAFVDLESDPVSLDLKLVVDADRVQELGGIDLKIVTPYIFRWINEKLEEPLGILNSTDNDRPPATLSNIVSYGSRIWGVNTEDQTIRYSKIGPNGYHFFPNENALIPHNFALEDAHQNIVKIHPAPNDSLLYVFKPDRIHFIRGHGDIKGLHSPNTPIDISIDASVKKENIGTVYPKSITTLKDNVLFLGSDKILYVLSGLSVQPFSISIQPIIEAYTDDDLKNTVAFEYRNCYHLCLPNEVLVLDLQKKYWTIIDWRVTDVFWAQDVGDNIFNDEDNEDDEDKRGDSIFAMLSGIKPDEPDADTLVRLYEDNHSEKFNCEWESNTSRLPYETTISGIHVYHDESSRGSLSVGIKMDNAEEYRWKTFKPSKRNRFRQGFHQKGHRIQVKIIDENDVDEKLRIDRIMVETTG